jgi:heme oxygenase
VTEKAASPCRDVRPEEAAMAGTVDRAGAARLSVRLRTGTRAEHDAAQRTVFVDNLLAGRLPRQEYAALTAQLFFVYESLESAAVAMAEDPVAGVFVFPELTRLPAIIADLEFLCGPDWADRIVALPATAAYCARLREVAFDRAAAFIAHHYTRYVGDLFGGQDIGRLAAEVYDLVDLGRRFYTFDGVRPDAFRDRYRAQLDALSWPPPEEDYFLSEVSRAYALNTAILHELGRRLT